jgi:hypothetical protein
MSEGYNGFAINGLPTAVFDILFTIRDSCKSRLRQGTCSGMGIPRCLQLAVKYLKAYFRLQKFPYYLRSLRTLQFDMPHRFFRNRYLQGSWL